MSGVKADKTSVPVFVLCGGQGTRLREQTEFRPKPMIEIGGRPVLWHIMRAYARHGFKRFVICLGYKGEMIKEYFLHYGSLNSDFTVELATNALTVHPAERTDDWTVTLVDTGENAMTGARVARAAAKYVGDAEHFAVTYGDGLTDADLASEFRFHRSTVG
jgi:glucose-1-phosphate cytidylyltransferase